MPAWAGPTDAPPGSEQKILVLTERAARRLPLFHPEDGSWARVGRKPDQEPRREAAFSIGDWPLDNPPFAIVDLDEFDDINDDLPATA
jgi:hypothetical protein